MRKANRICLSAFTLVLCLALFSGCSRLSGVELPPLPTPTVATPSPEPTPEPTPSPTPSPRAAASPAPTAAPAETEPAAAAEPSAAPAPEPQDPNTPRLSISDETVPENMAQYSTVNLLGEITTDKGQIAQVWGRITDAEGNVVQECVFYPYSQSFGLAGTVNAELHFGQLVPGSYVYVLSAVAESNAYHADVTLISHAFEVTSG